MVPSLLCSANPLLKTTLMFGIQLPQLVENRVAIHDRKEEIEDDETDSFPILLVNPQRFETIVRDDDFVAFVGQHLRRQLRDLRLHLPQSGSSSRLPFGFLT